MPLRADDMEPSEGKNFLVHFFPFFPFLLPRLLIIRFPFLTNGSTQNNVHSAPRHVGCDGYGAYSPGIRDNHGFFEMIFGI